jgi:hypothetical protein
VADPGPNNKRIAQLLRMLGSSNDGERRNAWSPLARLMRDDGVSWTDIGDAFEHSANGGSGKYTEAEMRELYATARAEGVEAGIKIGSASAQQANGRLTLPSPLKMAEHCHERLGRLKDDKQREFIRDMYLMTRRQTNLSLGRLGYLVSVYIQTGGSTE